ncbi:spore germination protein [Bacillus toyonensis]|uniref:spore germination protein n=1 Tax=Bacillus toyonensis TaxID=155322 RepID=UPI00209B58A8|nr:spore germination protein [Bacillus toyonensis]
MIRYPSHRKRETPVTDCDNVRYSNPSPLNTDLSENISELKTILGNSDDIVIRNIESHTENFQNVAIVHMDGISKEEIIETHIIEPLLKYNLSYDNTTSNLSMITKLEQTITASHLKRGENWDDVISAVLSGDTVVFLDGYKQALIASTKELQTRNVTEPTTQTVIRGPKDSFTENFRTNTSLIRSRIQSPNLQLETIKIGEITQTDIGLMYIRGLADSSILKEIKTRLQQITIDGILESNYIEELIQDDYLTPFPTILNTERPDAVTANLLEGRIAIFVHGTPYVLIGPATFIQFFQSPEDYYQHQYISSFLRILRFGTFIVSFLVPALYIAIISHHQGLIPTVLLVSLASQREGVPFPQIVEALIMELTFEVLREAGIRMPRAVGQALSIVGALILGQAAVQAGFVSAAIVIIVSITGISSFALPNYNIGIVSRLLRFIMLLAGAFIGLYGIVLTIFVIILHMCSLRSFGVPYLAPLAPFRIDEQQDALIRFSIKSLRKRPSPAVTQNKIRIKKQGNDGDINEN